MKKLFAFTLAETLIVMGIIGIVSALTLPNLNASTGEKEKIAKVKKIYRDLNDAVGRAAAVYGPLDEWGNNVTVFGNRITEFTKVSKNCGLLGTGDISACFSKANYSGFGPIGSGAVSGDIGSIYPFIMADGTSIAIDLSMPKDTTPVFYIDIDGPNKGARKQGVDLFMFIIDMENDTVIPLNSNELKFSSSWLACGAALEGGAWAASWVVNFDNMDYLKANSTGKCNSGSNTLNGTASPPVISCK